MGVLGVTSLVLRTLKTQKELNEEGLDIHTLVILGRADGQLSSFNGTPRVQGGSKQEFIQLPSTPKKRGT